MEFFQLVSIVPGTFDICDILTYSVTLLIIEMKNIKTFIFKVGQVFALAIFVFMAMASASNQEALSTKIGEESNSGNHDGTQLIETADSLSTDSYSNFFDYASAE